IVSNGGGDSLASEAPIVNSGTLTIMNSTLRDNRGLNNAAGAIDNFGALTITNSSLSGNSGGQAGAIANGGTLTISNSTLSGNITGCAITLGPKDLTEDPGLDLFIDNGIPGHGHFPLLPTSGAIDAGNDAACPPADQLGRPRVGHCDIGAIEFQPVPTPGVTFSYNGKLRDRVAPGSLGLGGDNALDGTLGATLHAAGGRTITRLRLQSSAPGTWDTDGNTSA